VVNGGAPKVRRLQQDFPNQTQRSSFGTQGFIRPYQQRYCRSLARSASITRLRRRPNAKVLIIGGGINGVGTFRDLALQGVDVALVERGDYCQGASGASSHMIHGGIRYLENGEFRLVRESVVERNRLLRIAPTTSSRCRPPSRSSAPSPVSWPRPCGS
jgi:NADPH-dependent 2,4-dienoyl-CoA reductase/sulfur reductase-like enzyme